MNKTYKLLIIILLFAIISCKKETMNNYYDGNNNGCVYINSVAIICTGNPFYMSLSSSNCNFLSDSIVENIGFDPPNTIYINKTMGHFYVRTNNMVEFIGESDDFKYLNGYWTITCTWAGLYAPDKVTWQSLDGTKTFYIKN